jgi:hypothetical protein
LLSSWALLSRSDTLDAWPMLAALHIPMRRTDGWYRFIRFRGEAAGFYDVADWCAARVKTTKIEIVQTIWRRKRWRRYSAS